MKAEEGWGISGWKCWHTDMTWHLETGWPESITSQNKNQIEEKWNVTEQQLWKLECNGKCLTLRGKMICPLTFQPQTDNTAWGPQSHFKAWQNTDNCLPLGSQNESRRKTQDSISQSRWRGPPGITQHWHYRWYLLGNHANGNRK